MNSFQFGKHDNAEDVVWCTGVVIRQQEHYSKLFVQQLHSALHQVQLMSVWLPYLV